MWQFKAPNDNFWLETAAVNGAGTVVILTKFHKDCKKIVDFFTYTEIFDLYPFLCITLYIIHLPKFYDL